MGIPRELPKFSDEITFYEPKNVFFFQKIRSNLVIPPTPLIGHWWKKGY
jgi:hypothetical protein